MASWPDLKALELLVAVADHGSLSAGARAANISQPNASRSMARLERTLGLPLLRRSTAGSQLTSNGLLVVQWAREIMEGAEKLMEGCAHLAAPGQESLTVVASQTIAEHLLPSWLARTLAVSPGTDVAVDVRNSRDALNAVVAGNAALGFIESPQVPRGVNHLRVAEDELILVVHPSHPWAGRTPPVTREELLATPLVTREKGSGTRLYLDETLGKPVTPALELHSNAAVRVSAQAGTGPAVLSRLAVSDAIATGTLCEVPTELRLRRTLRALWLGPRSLPGFAGLLVGAARASGKSR